MVVCLNRGADLYMAQMMPLPLTVKALKAELDRIKYSKKHYDNTDECILKTSLYVVLKNKSSLYTKLVQKHAYNC